MPRSPHLVSRNLREELQIGGWERHFLLKQATFIHFQEGSQASKNAFEVLAQHVLEGSICVARGKSSMPLHRWQAQYLLAALRRGAPLGLQTSLRSGQKNASMFLTVEVAEGCQLPDFNASADFVTAHDGSTAFERTAADFGTTSTTEASTTENATEADTTSMAPATTRAPGLEGKLEVLVDGPSVIVGA